MKKIKKLFVGLLFIMIYFLLSNSVQATGNVSLQASRGTVDVGDTFTVSINLSGVKIASLTARISIDTQKIQYVSGPSNSNYSNGRIIYTWTDPSGGDSPLTGGNIATFTFTAKNAGSANFNVSGDFFTPEEVSANPSFSGVTINVKNVENNESSGSNLSQSSEGNEGEQNNGNGGNQNNTNQSTTSGEINGGQAVGNVDSQSNISAETSENTENSAEINVGNYENNTGQTENAVQSQIVKEKGGSVQNTEKAINLENNIQVDNQNNMNVNQQASSNTKLKTLQLNVEGISPNFNSEIDQYYITIPIGISDIEVIAEPEDINSQIQVIGNTNIEEGTSQIIVHVIAQDGSKREYKINVTKTSDAKMSNANLINLAIENAVLSPEFSKEITEYYTEIWEDLDKLNILAIPENENASVQIEGNEMLQHGENRVQIKVIAEDGENSKIYSVIVKKNQESISNSDEKIENGGDKVAVNEKINTSIEENKRKERIGVSIAGVAVILCITIFIILKKRNDKDK